MQHQLLNGRDGKCSKDMENKTVLKSTENMEWKI